MNDYEKEDNNDIVQNLISDALLLNTNILNLKYSNIKDDTKPFCVFNLSDLFEQFEVLIPIDNNLDLENSDLFEVNSSDGNTVFFTKKTELVFKKVDYGVNFTNFSDDTFIKVNLKTNCLKISKKLFACNLEFLINYVNIIIDTSSKKNLKLYFIILGDMNQMLNTAYNNLLLYDKYKKPNKIHFANKISNNTDFNSNYKYFSDLNNLIAEEDIKKSAIDEFIEKRIKFKEDLKRDKELKKQQRKEKKNLNLS